MLYCLPLWLGALPRSDLDAGCRRALGVYFLERAAAQRAVLASPGGGYASRVPHEGAACG